MPEITFEQLMLLVAFILALIAAYNTIMTAVKNRREEKKLKESPMLQLVDRVDKHDMLFARSKQKFDELDSSFKGISEQSTIMLRGVRALLSHEVNGNSVDKLKASLGEIDDYLIERK